MTFSMNYNTTIVLTEESLDSIPLWEKSHSHSHLWKDPRS
jgi:hypothetical protein